MKWEEKKYEFKDPRSFGADVEYNKGFNECLDLCKQAVKDEMPSKDDIEHQLRCWVSDYKTSHLLKTTMGKEKADDICFSIMMFIVCYLKDEIHKLLMQRIEE